MAAGYSGGYGGARKSSLAAAHVDAAVDHRLPVVVSHLHVVEVLDPPGHEDIADLLSLGQTRRPG